MLTDGCFGDVGAFKGAPMLSAAAAATVVATVHEP